MADDSVALRTVTLLTVGQREGFCSAEFLAPAWGDRAYKASRVCRCESSADPAAVSPDGRYHGLFQVDAALHGSEPERLHNPLFNSASSAALQARDGWAPWPVCGFLPAQAGKGLP